jgi:Flp pilus assembly protein TadD
MLIAHEAETIDDFAHRLALDLSQRDNGTCGNYHGLLVVADRFDDAAAIAGRMRQMHEAPPCQPPASRT